MFFSMTRTCFPIESNTLSFTHGYSWLTPSPRPSTATWGGWLCMETFPPQAFCFSVWNFCHLQSQLKEDPLVEIYIEKFLYFFCTDRNYCSLSTKYLNVLNYPIANKYCILMEPVCNLFEGKDYDHFCSCMFTYLTHYYFLCHMTLVLCVYRYVEWTNTFGVFQEDCVYINKFILQCSC